MHRTDEDVDTHIAASARDDELRTVDWFLIGLAVQKSHLSLYVNAVVDGAYLPHRYADRLGRVKLGSASIAVRRVEDLDLVVLAEMAGEAVRLTRTPGRDAPDH